MNLNFTIVISFVLAAIFQTASAQAMRTEKDGIELNVTISRNEGSDTVSCVLTNRSEFPICSASILYKMVFYVTLTDANGKELTHDAEWAQKYAQKSSRVYKNPRSHTGFQIEPGDSVNWDFDLEDAYPESSLEQARKLELSWESQYPGTEVDLDGNPYHFPPDWRISLTMPLADAGIGPVPEGGVDAEDIPTTQSEVKEANDKNRFPWTISGMVMGTILIAILLKFWIGKTAR